MSSNVMMKDLFLIQTETSRLQERLSHVRHQHYMRHYIHQKRFNGRVYHRSWRVQHFTELRLVKRPNKITSSVKISVSAASQNCQLQISQCRNSKQVGDSNKTRYIECWYGDQPFKHIFKSSGSVTPHFILRYWSLENRHCN